MIRRSKLLLAGVMVAAALSVGGTGRLITEGKESVLGPPALSPARMA